MGDVRNTTKWILGVSFLVLIIWDVIAFVATDNATISVIITDWSMYTPWVPFAFGVLMGHWFFPAKGSND